MLTDHEIRRIEAAADAAARWTGAAIEILSAVLCGAVFTAWIIGIFGPA